MGGLWNVQLLGGLRADSDDTSISRFRTRKVGLLLAYLAYYQGRSHSREELCDLLWPDLESDLAKRNLRQALSSLRHHLEPPPVPSGAVLQTQQALVQLNSAFVTTDVALFNDYLSAKPDGARSLERMSKAVEIYSGDLLPGFYDDWVARERLHLEDRYVAALKSCLTAAESEGRLDDAIRFVQLAISKESMSEELHEKLIRLYVATDRTDRAAQQFEVWRKISKAELRSEPSPELRRFVEQARRSRPSRPISTKAPQAEADATEEKVAEPVVKLPLQLTRYFGRTKELEFAGAAIANRDSRLITITGPAGAGKTRLSIEVGKALTSGRRWNVWFVPLADISDGSELVHAVLSVLKLETNDRDPVEALAGRLEGQDNLLILDNLEHIVDAAIPGISEILANVPNVSVLVTSRRSLKLGGEQELGLSTLPAPPEGDTHSIELSEFAGFPSVQLYVDRARAAMPDFQLTVNNAATIAEICRKLDGLPLALEIAASLSGALSPVQTLQNLDNRLELLKSRRRDLSPRHQSLSAAIDYGYQLLTETEREFFLTLSVFRGGFTLEAAAKVHSSPDLLPAERGRREDLNYLNMIMELQERSLVQAEDSRNQAEPRFRLLESFREFGEETMDEAMKLDVKKRHAAYYLELGLAKKLPPEDRENRNAAIRTLYEIGNITDCTALLCSVEDFAIVEQNLVKKMAESEAFCAYSPIDQSRILRRMATQQVHHSQFSEALENCERGLKIAEAAGLKEEELLYRRKLSTIFSYLNRREESIEQSRIELEMGREMGDLETIQTANNNLAGNYWALGRFQEALEVAENSYAASKQLHRGAAIWPILYNLALVYLDSDLLEEGLETAQEGIRLARNNDEPFGVSLCMCLVARYYLYRGNLEAAIATSFESMQKRRSLGFGYWVSQSIFFHAAVLIEMKKYREATTLIGACRLVARVNTREESMHTARLRSALSSAEFERAWAKGLAMNVDEAFRLASKFR